MEKIGFIGLGIMGKPMAINLLKAGYVVNILSASKSSKLIGEEGAIICDSLKSLTENSSIIITMLPDSPEVEEIILGKGGVGASISTGKLIIDMSTIAPSVSKKIYENLLEKGVDVLDAPVSGGQVGAEAATLSIMVGGSEPAFERALPILQIMGKNIVRIGEAGAGQMTKACNQLIVGMTIQAVSEAFNLAALAGVDLVKMREVLLGGFAQSRILDLHGQRIIDENFKPGFKIRLHQKDMSIVLAEGQEFEASLPGASLVSKQMGKVIANGNGELDHSSLILALKTENLK